jgi:hypothetical protein
MTILSKKLFFVTIVAMMELVSNDAMAAAKSVTWIGNILGNDANLYQYFDGTTTRNYNLTSYTGSFNSNNNVLVNQPWFVTNDPSAEASLLFVTAMGARNGTPNVSAYSGLTDNAPFFAIINNGMIFSRTWNTTYQQSHDWNISLTDTKTWAVATLAPVPEADTSAMLLMGAGVMGFMARRRKQVAA